MGVCGGLCPKEKGADGWWLMADWVGVACQQFAIFSIKLRNMRVYNYATIFSAAGLGPESRKNQN